MTVSNALIDCLLTDCKQPEDLIGECGVLKQLTKKQMKRFFRSFKTETQHNDALTTPDEIIWITRTYVHFYNNTQRIHSSNGYQAPQLI